jgi:hypothetical protein
MTAVSKHACAAFIRRFIATATRLTELPAGATRLEVVKAFLKDWEVGFVPAFDPWLHPDCLWTNAGQRDCRGKAEIKESGPPSWG